MDGPWTQFAPATPDAPAAPAPAADGPWTQFAKPAPVAPNPNAGANEYGITDDPQQFNKPLTPAEQGLANTANAVVQGAKEGFGPGPLGVSPQTDQALTQAGVFNGPDENSPLRGLNRAVITPLAAAGDLALRTGGALVGAYQHGISQAGEEVGAPQLGRDLAALPEAFPTGDSTGGTAIPHAPVGEPAPNPLAREISPAAHDALEAPLPAAFRDNPGVTVPSMVGETMLNPLVAERPADFSPPQQNPLAAYGPEQPTAPSAPAPGPSSVGAAASRDMTNPSLIAMAPREAAASQATGESWRLAQPAVQGEDKTEYVKGVVPTAAETSGNADVAGEQKYVVQTPGMAEQNRLQQTRNNDARVDHYDDLAGTQTIVNTMSEARDAQAQQDLAAAWSNKQPVDAQPIVDQIDQVLAGPQGKLTAVKSALTSIRNTLHDADGNLETDPETLYGARREVANMLGKAAQVEKPTLKDAARQIGTVKDALDQTIEAGAPGYKQYLDNYSAASKPINARQLLLDAKPDLTSGSERMMTFGKVDRLMKGIVADRQAPGVNAAKSLDDPTMDGLWNLHSDLKRQNNVDLGRPRGSDTSSLLRKGVSLGSWGAAHVVANKLLPVAGSFIVKGFQDMSEKRQLQGKMNQLMDGMNFTAPKN
jgi:hypothetical protein